jgi:hypothetical protein
VSRGAQIGLGLVAAMAFAVPVASADVIAVLEHQAPGRQDSDIIRVNAGTGAVTPAAFNTTAGDVHPSVSSDGNRIAFERWDPASGEAQFLVNNLRTGQTFPVSGSCCGVLAPGNPTDEASISPDGQTLVSGAGFEILSNSTYAPRVALTSLSAFPNGPFPQSTEQLQVSFSNLGFDVEPVVSGSLVASGVGFLLPGPAPTLGIVLGQLDGSAAPPLVSSTVQYSHPAIGSPGGVPTVLFEESSLQGASIGLASRPAFPLSSFAGPPMPLTGVNTSDSLDPAFTSDGRYIGFLRSFPHRQDSFLFVWDTATQTLINPAGVDVGNISVESTHGNPEPLAENLGLYELTVFQGPGTITTAGTVNFQLLQGSAVGILVQRVVGHHKLFGRTVSTLQAVGRVPLGMFKRGSRHVHWNLEVNGHRLTRGTYQVTLRSLTASKQIRDFGVPHLIRVR